MARSDVAIKFFPTAQLLGPISRDRTGPVEHPLVGPAKGFYRCANIIEEGEGALLKAPGSVLPDIAVMVANRGLPCAIAASHLGMGGGDAPCSVGIGGIEVANIIGGEMERRAQPIQLRAELGGDRRASAGPEATLAGPKHPAIGKEPCRER